MPTRAWTSEEDEAIRAACARSRKVGMVEEDDEGRRHENRAKRLQAIAEKTGRTLAAVRKRAQRIGARSYRPSWIINPAAARAQQREMLERLDEADRTKWTS